jgi:hypothetical protein
MKYLVLATLVLACLSGSASAQFDTLYGARGFLGGVRPDAAQIIQRCRGQKECIRATAKRTPMPETPGVVAATLSTVIPALGRLPRAAAVSSSNEDQMSYSREPGLLG